MVGRKQAFHLLARRSHLAVQRDSQSVDNQSGSTGATTPRRKPTATGINAYLTLVHSQRLYELKCACLVFYFATATGRASR